MTGVFLYTRMTRVFRLPHNHGTFFFFFGFENVYMKSLHGGCFLLLFSFYVMGYI